MLAAEALRLAAVETLCPTAALLSGTGFPTMAGRHVFDSRATALDDLDPDAVWTPTLSVYSETVTVKPYGDIAPSVRGDAHAMLSIEAELAVKEQDADGAFADAARSDPDAKLMLGALCAQVRRRLVYAPESLLFSTRLVKTVVEFQVTPFTVPNLALRWMRASINMMCHIADDDFSDAAGLPAPLSRLMAVLPPESYAMARLTQLNALFAATSREALSSIYLHVPPLSAAVSLPTAEIPTLGINLP